MVDLVVTGDGGQDTSQTTITVSKPPDAPEISIAANPESGDVPLSVQFTVQSTGGNITAYAWDFGDGTTSNEASPSHSYTGQGTFEVILNVEGPGGTDSATGIVTAVEPIQPPTADFEAVIVDDRVGLTVDFINRSTGEGLTYNWAFGDRATSSEESPQHTYPDYGFYNVTLTVVNSAGESTDTIQIELPPPLTSVQAVASAAPLTTIIGKSIQFDASGSTGDIASYSWDFGDGSGTSTERSPVYAYQANGEYTVTLSLVGQDGSSSQSTVVIQITPPLQAAFTLNPEMVVFGVPVTFDSSGSTGNIVTYAWNFGDGGTSAEANPTYTYAAPGTYPVSLVVSDVVTQSEATGQVAVSAALQAAFVPNPQAVTLGTPIAFDSSGSTGQHCELCMELRRWWNERGSKPDLHLCRTGHLPREFGCQRWRHAE